MSRKKTKKARKVAAKKNPCRIIKVKRKTGKSKLDRVVYARRKVCFNPMMDSESIKERLEHLSSLKARVIIKIGNGKDEINFEGFIYQKFENPNWFRIVNPITYRIILIKVDNVLDINNNIVTVDNYLPDRSSLAFST